MQGPSTKGARLLCASCALAIAAIPALLQAQAPAPGRAPSSTMASLAKTVIETNPDIEAQRQQVRITKARLATAEAGYFPTVEANGTVQRREIDVKNGGRGDSKYTSANGAIEARLRFYDGNRTYNSVQIATAEMAAAEAGLDATISDTLLDLLTSAADVHLQRKVLEYSQQQSDAIGEQLRATSRKLEFGEATRTDEELAKARLATAQAGVLAATEELNVNGYEFRTVSGQSATTLPALPALAPVPDSLASAQKIALENAPRLRAARLNAEAGKAGVQFAAGALFPQVDAVGGYEYLAGGVANLFTGKLPDDRSSLYGGVEVRVPIFVPRDHAEIGRARAVRDQRLSQTDIATRAAAEEVASYWTRWQSAKSTIVTATAAVAAIEQAAEGLKKEALGGNRTLTDVLDAQNELLTARVTLERANRNEFVARAGLLAAIGRLDGDAILEGRCCAAGAAGTVSRPGASALGRPAAGESIASGDASAKASATPVRPGQSTLGSAPVASAPAVPSSGGEAATPAASLGGRPSASALGRRVK